MHARFVTASCLAVACSTASPVPEVPPEESPEKSPEVSAAQDGSGVKGLEGLGAAVLAKVCASPCAGEFARIHVFRGEDGKVGRLLFDGDLQSCSHPPRIYFDGAGEETLAIPNKPVAAGSPEAEDFAREQAAEVEGLEEAETLGCPP